MKTIKLEIPKKKIEITEEDQAKYKNLFSNYLELDVLNVFKIYLGDEIYNDYHLGSFISIAKLSLLNFRCFAAERYKDIYPECEFEKNPYYPIPVRREKEFCFIGFDDFDLLCKYFISMSENKEWFKKEQIYKEEKYWKLIFNIIKRLNEKAYEWKKVGVLKWKPYIWNDLCGFYFLPTEIQKIKNFYKKKKQKEFF